MNRYENLANAIITQAVKDYRRAHRKLKEEPDDTKALKTVDEVERFFRSGWFGRLTALDGNRILGRLKEEFDV